MSQQKVVIESQNGTTFHRHLTEVSSVPGPSKELQLLSLRSGDDIVVKTLDALIFVTATVVSLMIIAGTVAWWLGG